MKKLFYLGLTGLLVFEFLKIYLIMPFPGSQKMESIDVAYFLYRYRWGFRVLFIIMTVSGIIPVLSARRKWIPAIVFLIVAALVYLLNFEMSADKMFKQPKKLSFKNIFENKVKGNDLVVGVENNGVAKAYPIQFLIYHHQVEDTVGGKPVIVTYCSVCHTGRVFEPVVNNKHEKFRLVGMDHFNAMFEDALTKSWWRQATGEAIAGPLKGNTLPEFASMQATIDKWFTLYPNALVMQADEASDEQYDSLRRFEQGKSKGGLTHTDSLSWKDKSWIIGIQIENSSKAYDWNRLKKERIINDEIGDTPIVLVMSMDTLNFAAFQRPEKTIEFTLSSDTLVSQESMYDLFGRNLEDPSQQLKRVSAYQEFWHSWKTFHPTTETY